MTNLSISPDLQFTLRHPTRDDATAMFALINRCETEDVGEPRLTWDELLNDLTGTPQANQWVAVTPENQILGSNVMFEWAPGDFAAYLYVNRDYINDGVAVGLIQAAEQRAREVMPPTGEAFLRMYAAEGNPLVERHYTALGFHVLTHIFEMAIEFTTPPPAATWPADLNFRLINSPAEDEEVWQVVEDAFAQPKRNRRLFADWRERVFEGPGFDISLFYVVTNVAGEIVAAMHNKNLDGVTDVAQLVVREDHRKRGIALNMLYELFNEVYRRGGRNVTLGVDGQNPTNAISVYRRAGMSPTSHFIKWEKILRAE